MEKIGESEVIKASNLGGKTIAKNTIFLSLRMFVTLGISLYTSRIVLDVLGVTDFGIYNVVGGVVILFTFLNTAMSSATQRFFAFSIGESNLVKLNQVFSCSLVIHFLIALIILLLGETVGLWFVNYKLNVPGDRMLAVNWVYQLSILTCLITIIQVPYNALIVAYERMHVFAVASILESVLKLLSILIVSGLALDKLKVYSFAIFLITLVVTLIYVVYSRFKFEKIKFLYPLEKSQFSSLLSFSGWSLFGNLAGVAKGQGVNIVLNLVFGTIVNASYGIMMQVQNAVNSFVGNFLMALNPQIIKSYSSNNKERTSYLVFTGVKISFSIMFCLVVPLLVYLDDIVNFWLKNPPDYAILFIRLCLINLLIDSLSGSIMAGIQASGHIRGYQICVGLLMLANLPLSFLFVNIYGAPELVFYVSIVISFLALVLRLYFLQRKTGIKVSVFFTNILPRLMITAGLTVVPLFLIGDYFFVAASWHAMLSGIILLELFISVLIFLIVFNNKERCLAYEFVKSKF